MFVFILAMATLLTLLPSATAADQETRAFLALNPNPVGVNQNVDVTAILQPIPPLATDKFHGMVVTITKPDGTTETKGPYTSSAIGSQYFVYTPTMVGTYKFQFSYPGETFASANFLPSESPITELVVQQAAIQPYPDAQLPTGYWTRPINAQNRNWYPIAGNWLMRSYSSYYGSFGEVTGFNPYTQAARAPHVMWTKELTLGGLIGGEYGAFSYYAGHSYEPKLAPPIIMNGRLYYKTYQSGYSGAQGSIGTGFICVDLRTGEEIWTKTTGIVSHGQVFNYISGNQMGGIGYLWNVANGAYQMYDAFTGDLFATFTGATAGDVLYGDDGTMYVYILNSRNGWFLKWNSTKACEAAGFDERTPAGLGLWRPKSGTYNWSKGIEWNTTVPIRSITTPAGGVSYPTVRARQFSGDIMYAVGGGTAEARLHVAYSLSTGKELWAIERNDMSRVYPMFFSTGDGFYAQFDPLSMSYIAYDLTTGAELWVSDPLDYPFGQYIANSVGGVFAYGKFYVGGMDGVIHCFDAHTGRKLWKFSSGNSGLETPYGAWPMGNGPILADGVVYTGVGEHSPTNPLIRGGKLYALNAETGEKLWDMNGWVSVTAIADGYLVGYNLYDNRIYCIGKGPSATEVTVSPKVVVGGSDVLIEGKVTDQSSGQPGTPAVSDEDMGVYMAHLLQQQALPTHVRGVPVHLTAHSESGSTINIGTVVSDAYGTFEYKWTPPSEGTYKIIAAFAGSDSYGDSSATTSLAVSAQPEVTEEAATYTAIDIVLIVAVVVVALLVVFNIFAVRKMRK